MHIKIDQRIAGAESVVSMKNVQNAHSNARDVMRLGIHVGLVMKQLISQTHNFQLRSAYYRLDRRRFRKVWSIFHRNREKVLDDMGKSGNMKNCWVNLEICEVWGVYLEFSLLVSFLAWLRFRSKSIFRTSFYFRFISEFAFVFIESSNSGSFSPCIRKWTLFYYIPVALTYIS